MSDAKHRLEDQSAGKQAHAAIAKAKGEAV